MGEVYIEVTAAVDVITVVKADVSISADVVVSGR